MEEEIRKDFNELLRLMMEGKRMLFKEKAAECLPVDIAEGLEEIEDDSLLEGILGTVVELLSDNN